MFYSDRNTIVCVCVCEAEMSVCWWHLLPALKDLLRALGNDPLSENTNTLVLLYHH